MFLTALSRLLYRECSEINGEQVTVGDEAALPYLKLLAGVQPETQELLTIAGGSVKVRTVYL